MSSLNLNLLTITVLVLVLQMISYLLIIPFIPVDKGSHWNTMLVLIMLTAMKLLGAVSGATHIHTI